MANFFLLTLIYDESILISKLNLTSYIARKIMAALPWSVPRNPCSFKFWVSHIRDKSFIGFMRAEQTLAGESNKKLVFL